MRLGWTRRSALVALLAATAAGCVPNDYGRLSATRTGATLEPPAARVRERDRLEEACGAPSYRAGALERRPYVQRVGPDGATIVWTSRAERPERVELSPPGAARVAYAGAREPTRFLRGAHQYAVRLADLEPSTTYCYSIADDDGVVHGPIGFRTAPPRGADVPVRILAFGDSGTGNTDQWALREQMETVPIDLILHMGDLAYQSGTLPQLERYFFDVYEGLLDSFPVYPALGNHEYRTAAAGPTLEVFDLPDNGGPDARERYYSFDWGPVHVVALDTERFDGAQAEWLERDLAATDLPWTIVIAHRSAFSSGHYGSNGTWIQRFVPILERHGVQLVLTGHDHHYERTTPMRGVTYVVTGAGGGSTRRPDPQPFTVFAEDVVHFVSIVVDGDELRLHAIDAAGREFDAVRVRRRG